MIEPASRAHRFQPLIAAATSTATRCHCLGAATSVALATTIAWVGACGQWQATTVEYADRDIDLSAAVTLIENADQWRQLYTSNYEASQKVDRRVQEISNWLPSTIEWTKIEQSLVESARSNELTVLSIKQGSRHVGSRVGILAAQCDLTGSYPDVCRFLNAINDLPCPIACSELRLDRIKPTDDEATQEKNQMCRVTLSLRIPFAAEGSAAAELVSLTTSNSSPRELRNGT